jgi:hypothetical protein
MDPEHWFFGSILLVDQLKIGCQESSSQCIVHLKLIFQLRNIKHSKCLFRLNLYGIPPAMHAVAACSASRLKYTIKMGVGFLLLNPDPDTTFSE